MYITAYLQVAYASRTDCPDWADECMDLITVSGTSLSLRSAAHILEIYDANKQQHFKEMHRKTGIPFHRMLFFDNQMDNIQSVGKLGVVCMYTPNGMTKAFWTEGLAKFAASIKKMAK